MAVLPLSRTPALAREQSQPQPQGPASPNPWQTGKSHARQGLAWTWPGGEEGPWGPSPRASAVLLDVLEGGHINLDRGAHGGGDVEALPVTALGATGLVAVDGFLQGLEVVEQVVATEAGLAKAHVDDAGAVRPELQFAGLEFVDGARQVGGHGAGLGVGHQAAGAEHPAQLRHLGHHVRGGDQQIKVHLTGGNRVDQLVIASQVGAGGLGGSHLLAPGDHGDANRLAGAVGQGHGGAQLLVGVLGIDAEARVGLERFIELGGGVLLDQLERLDGRVDAVFDRLQQA